MSRLRYPFTEISAHCRLCGAIGFTASSEHALGGRLIDWRREHAKTCPEWPRWAAGKGLALDQNGALLYPNETGPYEPRQRKRSDGEDAEVDSNEAPAADGARTGETERAADIAARPDAAPGEPASGVAPSNGRAAHPPKPLVDLLTVPSEQLEQTTLF